MRSKIGNDETMNFVAKLIDTFRIDVSYMTDEEYAGCLKTIYNALEYAEIDKSKLTGEKYMKKSVGIGSQISQISGVFYLTQIQGMCDELGLFINPKKTQIIKLSKGFTFLKIKYILTDTGKVVERISRDGITRMRRKLKKLRKKLDAGEVTFEDVRCAYASWRGDKKHYDSYTTLKNMDKLFNELFIEPFIEGGIGNGRKADNGAKD